MVQKVLPAIRAELSRTMINDYELRQQDVATILGLTRAAISQYVSAKRGDEVIFNTEVKDEIKKFADVLINKDPSTREKARGICRVCCFVQVSGWLEKNAPKQEVCILCNESY